MKGKDMKPGIWILLLSALVVSCNNEGSSTEQKLDSLETRIDTTADKVWDSTKAKAKELKEKIEREIEERDSANRVDTIKKQ